MVGTHNVIQNELLAGLPQHHKPSSSSPQKPPASGASPPKLHREDVTPPKAPTPSAAVAAAAAAAIRSPVSSHPAEKPSERVAGASVSPSRARGARGTGRRTATARPRAKKDTPPSSSSAAPAKSQETLDDRIKDIITTALMDPSPDAKSAAPPPRKRPAGKNSRANDDNNTTKSVISSVARSSLDSSTTSVAASLPVSIPLASVQAAAKLNSKHLSRRVAGAAAAGRKPHDSYSPISRPGSSSSTASAESVRALVHDAARPHSPHTVPQLPGERPMHTSSSGVSRGSGRPGSVPVTSKTDGGAGEHDVKPPRPLPAAAAAAGLGMYAGYPNVGAMLLSNQYQYAAANRHLYDKMLLSSAAGYPSMFNAQLEAASMFYQQYNGLSKPPAPAAAENSSKRRARRASGNSTANDVTGGGGKSKQPGGGGARPESGYRSSPKPSHQSAGMNQSQTQQLPLVPHMSSAHLLQPPQ